MAGDAVPDSPAQQALLPTRVDTETFNVGETNKTSSSRRCLGLVGVLVICVAVAGSGFLLFTQDATVGDVKSDSFYENHPRSDERNSRSAGQCSDTWSVGTPIADIPPSINSALSGYNPIIGNTLPTHGTNPGERDQIFMATKTINDELYLEDNINYNHDVRCKLSSTTEVINSYQDYQALKSGSTSFSHTSTNYFNLNVEFGISVLTSL